MATPSGQPSTTRSYPTHDNMLGGVQMTMPAHLLDPQEWRTQHNFRLKPELTQLPHKVLEATVGSEAITWLGAVPQGNGYGKLLLFTDTAVRNIAGTAFVTGLTTDTNFRQWATTVYNGAIYYTNELNAIRRNDGAADVAISNAPKGRYLAMWYDHLVVGYPVFESQIYPNRVMISDLGVFSDASITIPATIGARTITTKAWTPSPTNEADYYDFVEWQQSDYPYLGVTGIGKLRGTMWIYTPTAIIPLRYVGLPKVIQVQEEGIVTRVGNTFPWTLVCLDNVHFFYDGIEQMFWAFDGQQLTPIGEAVRKFMQDNLNTTPALAARMYGYVDVDNREVWWPFVSTNSAGPFDLAVVFNYRYKRWYTASVEDYRSFCGSLRTIADVSALVGIVSALTGIAGDLGLGTSVQKRLFGSTAGKLYREELTTDAVGVLITQASPVLESADYHYGDLRTTKETDLVVLNANWDTTLNPTGAVAVSVSSRAYLGETPSFTACGNWIPSLQDGLLDFPAITGRVLRYKFTFNNVRNAVFSAFSEGVYSRRSDK